MLLVTTARAQTQSSGSPLGPDRGWVIALATAPDSNGDTESWAAIYGGRIFATTTNGAGWEPRRTGITDPVVTGLAVSPAFDTDRTVFAAADDGVFKSNDSGGDWQQIDNGLGGHACRALAIDPGFEVNHRMWVATDGGVFRSTDGGASWSATSLTAPTTSIAANAYGTVLAGLASGGIQRSADAGLTWAVATGVPSTVSALSLTISASDRALAGTDDGIYASLDGGVRWEASGARGDRIDTVALSPAFDADHIAIAGSSSGRGVYETSDSGQTWRPLTSPPNAFISSAVVSSGAANDLTFEVGTAGGGIYISTDSGQTWSEDSDGLAAAQSDQLSLSGGQVLEAGLGGAALFAGSAWDEIPLGTTFVTSASWASPDVFIGTQDRGLQISYDSGTTWHASATPFGDVAAVQISPTFHMDSTLLVASDNVYLSTDSGITWKAAQGISGDDVRRFAFSPDFDVDRTVFAATINHRVYRSVDGGLTWTQTATGLPSSQISDVLPSVSFATDETVYAATAGSGIYRSEDDGMTWTPIASQPPHGIVNAVAWTSDGHVIAGTEKGVFVETDSGWEQLGNGWDGYVTDLKVDSEDGSEVLYAGTLGDGVWRFTLSSAGSTGSPAATPPTPSATLMPTPVPTQPVRQLHAWVDPKPLRAGDVGLLRIQGPAGATVGVTMTAPSWHRSTEAMLDGSGQASVALIAPNGDFVVAVSLLGSAAKSVTRVTVNVTP